MRILKKLRFAAAAAIVCGYFLPVHSGLAELREVTLVLDENASNHTLTGSLKINDVNEAEVALLPQKTAAQTNTGQASNFSRLAGSLRAVVEFDGNTPVKVQLAGGHYIPQISGDYCPPPFPEHSPDNNDNECPTEAPGAYGLVIAGDIRSVGRDTFYTLRGQSDISGTSINGQNWHFYSIANRNDFDGITALDDTTDILDVEQRWNSTDDTDNAFPFGDTPVNKPAFDNVDRATLINAFHLENDPRADDFSPPVPPQVNETTYFAGSFSVAGENATLSMPIWIPGLLATDLTDPDPAEFIRAHWEGDVVASGTFETGSLTPGDANKDGKIDGLDVNIVSKHWHKGDGNDHVVDQLEVHVRTHGKYANFFEGDFDLDGNVTETDWAIVGGGFAPGAGSGSGSGVNSVPEPTSLLLAGMGLALLALVKRRAR